MSEDKPIERTIEFQKKLRESMVKRGWNPAEKLMDIYDKLSVDAHKLTTGKGDKQRFCDDVDVLEIQRKIAVDLEKLAQKEEEITIKKVDAMKGLGSGGPTLLYATSMREEKLPDGRTVMVPEQTMELENRANDK